MLRNRAGLTLIEILMATVILALSAAAAMNVFTTSSMGIRKTDERRELRYYLREIFAHVNRQALHKLWDHFGPSGPGLPPRPLGGSLALVDAQGKLVDPANPGNNPLGFDQGFLDDLRRDGLDAKVEFMFYPRNELLVGPNGEPNPHVGLRYMQTGYAGVILFDREDPQERQLIRWNQPVMCPAIVGRPGLQQSSCPALNPSIKCQYGGWLAIFEGRPRAADECP